MTSDAPLPGLATGAELAAGRRVVRCGMCGRPLESRAARMRGVGEGCRHKLDDGPVVRQPGRFDVEQEALFGERSEFELVWDRDAADPSQRVSYLRNG